MTPEQIERAIACVTDREARDFLARLLTLIHGPAAGVADSFLEVEIAEAFPPATDQYTGWKRTDPCVRCGRVKGDRDHILDAGGLGLWHSYQPPAAP